MSSEVSTNMESRLVGSFLVARGRMRGRAVLCAGGL
jgi:hypothetical protein